MAQIYEYLVRNFFEEVWKFLCTLLGWWCLLLKFVCKVLGWWCSINPSSWSAMPLWFNSLCVQNLFCLYCRSYLKRCRYYTVVDLAYLLQKDTVVLKYVYAILVCSFLSIVFVLYVSVRCVVLVLTIFVWTIASSSLRRNKHIRAFFNCFCFNRLHQRSHDDRDRMEPR